MDNRTTAANKGFAIAGVTCFADNFVLSESVVLRIKFGAINPRHRKPSERYPQLVGSIGTSSSVQEMNNSMRTSQSKCLHCKVNDATQENSHIIPKFLTKTILVHNKGRRAYIIGTDNMHLAPEFSQDTVKEDFILCPSCEQYFSILETYISRTLHNKLWDKSCTDEFTTLEKRGIRWKVCNEVSPVIFRLFIYSIVWRCSISSHKTYKDFLLETEEEEKLRLSLLFCKYEKENELLLNLSNVENYISLPQFIIFTAESFGNKTSNSIFINPDIKNPYLLILNEYILLFSFKINMTAKFFDTLNNTKIEPINIGFFKQDFWENFKMQQLQMAMERAANYMREIGETPWIIKQENKINKVL